MSARSLACAILATIALAGCYPVNESFFEPSAEGAVTLGAYCLRGGPKDVAVFSLDLSQPYIPFESPSVPRVYFSAHREKGSNETAILFVWASIKDSRITLLDPFGIKAFAVRDGRPLKVEPKKYLPDSSKKLARLFWEPAWFEILIGDARSFIVSIPAIKYLDATVEIPDIMFVEKTEVFLAPINC